MMYKAIANITLENMILANRIVEVVSEGIGENEQIAIMNALTAQHVKLKQLGNEIVKVEINVKLV